MVSRKVTKHQTYTTCQQECCIHANPRNGNPASSYLVRTKPCDSPCKDSPQMAAHEHTRHQGRNTETLAVKTIPANNKKQNKVISERVWSFLNEISISPVTLWLVIMGDNFTKYPFTIRRPNHSWNSVSLECENLKILQYSCQSNLTMEAKDVDVPTNIRGLIQENLNGCKKMVFLYLSIPPSAYSHC